MITTRHIAAVVLLSASFVAVAGTTRHAAPAEINATRVTVSSTTTAGGEAMPVVTVTARRLTNFEKLASALKDARDALVTRTVG